MMYWKHHAIQGAAPCRFLAGRVEGLSPQGIYVGWSKGHAGQSRQILADFSFNADMDVPGSK